MVIHGCWPVVSDREGKDIVYIEISGTGTGTCMPIYTLLVWSGCVDCYCVGMDEVCGIGLGWCEMRVVLYC